MFEKAELGTDVVREVTLRYTSHSERDPVRDAVDEFVRLRRAADAFTPYSAFVKKWLREEPLDTDSAESSVAKLFVVENPNSPKKLQVFVWTAEVANLFCKRIGYAFLLQNVDTCNSLCKLFVCLCTL
ncbi:hypothetical protein AAVH_11174 [Aphelenchoides avenae]|nr:hypothetical protein AAVH_11174 [Aphelenchus avenae]